MGESFQFEAIGTHWTIDIYDENRDQNRRATLRERVYERIDEYDRTYSRFRDDSVLMKASRTPGTYQFPPDSKELFRLYRSLYDQTNGALTPLIGTVLDTAGYDAQYTLMPKGPLVSPPSWDEVMSLHEQSLTTYAPTIIDVGAGGKGHLIDIVGLLMESEGITAYTIDAGGDIRHRSREEGTLSVGLENPESTDEVVGVAEIRNESICGSAGNRRAWGTYHHIMNPFTLTSPHHIRAVWVVADTTFLADMLTTALFFVTPDVLLPHYVFAYAILDQEGEMTCSLDFPGEFFTRTSLRTPSASGEEREYS